MGKHKTVKETIEKFKNIKTEYYTFLDENYGIKEMLLGGLKPKYEDTEIKDFFKVKRIILSKAETCLRNIYDLSITENYYFFDCPFSVYKKTLDDRKDLFHKKYIDADTDMFYKSELFKLNHPEQYRVLLDENKNEINYSSFVESNTTSFKLSLNKKIKYLNSLLDKEKKTKIFQDDSEEAWFKDTLEELGVIDSANTAISGFQVAANTIFNNKDCRDNIFKFNLSKAVYIRYLNKKFDAQIKDKYKLSEGHTYEKEVEKLIKIYLER